MSAPAFNSVNALTGDVADRPSRFFGALSEADHFCRELDTVHELRTRLQEVAAERDALAGELADAREANQLLLEANGKLRRKVETLTTERNTWRAAADA